MTNSNNNVHPYPREKTIHSFFEEAAIKEPNRIAVEFEYESITYGELNKRADNIAAVLYHSNIIIGDIVAISAERSLDMMALSYS